MHFGVAVLATAIDIKQGVRASCIGLMALLNVAALTKLRAAQCEKRFVIGAVRRMTVHAVLPHWRMLPEEGTSLVLMAGVALIVDGIGADRLLGLRPVRVVTGGALQL